MQIRVLLRRLGVLFVFFAGFASGAATQAKGEEKPTGPVLADLYAETYFDAFRNLATHSSHLRLFWRAETHLEPYAAVGVEWAAPFEDGKTWRPHDWSHWYEGLGLRWGSDSIQLFLEGRWRHWPDKDFPRRTGAKAAEYRALLVLSHWWDFPSSWGGVWFADAYSETLATTADHDNALANGYLRLGHRFHLTGTTDLDAHVRPYLARDRQGEFAQNRQEWETGLRLVSSLPLVTAAIGGGYVLAEKLPARRQEGTDSARHLAGWRFYVILGKAWP